MISPKKKVIEQELKHWKKLLVPANFLKINTLTLYTFSTENRKRYKKEVDFLMNLLKKYTDEYLPAIKKRSTRFYLLGNSAFIPKNTRLKLLKITEDTKKIKHSIFA